MKTQPFEGGKVTQALTVGFQSGGNKPPLVARRFEDVWSVWDWKENGGRRGDHLNGRQSKKKWLEHSSITYVFLRSHPLLPSSIPS